MSKFTESTAPAYMYLKRTAKTREGLMALKVFGLHLEVKVQILKERKVDNHIDKILVKKPGQRRPEWVWPSDVVEIGRLPRTTAAPNQSQPLTKSEQREYARLFDAWTANGGKGDGAKNAELLTQEQITRFIHLADRLSATQQTAL